LTASTATGGGTVSSASSTGFLGKLAAFKVSLGIAATTVVAAGIATSAAFWPRPTPLNPAPVYTQPAAVFETGKKGVRGHTFAVNDQFLATGNEDGTIDLWEIGTSRLAFRLGGNADDAALALDFSPDQKFLATVGNAGMIKLWDLETRQEVATLPAQPRPIQNNSLAFSADGTLLASGAWNTAVMVFDVKTRRQRYEQYWVHNDGVMAVRFSPDGKLLGSGSWDGVINIWEATSGKPLRKLAAHAPGGWIGLAFAPNGTLASGGLDKSVKIWNWADGTVQAHLQGHTGPVCSVCWSPDGKLLASGSQDGTAKLWDAQTGRLLATYECQDQAMQVLFTTDGKLLVTAGWNTPLMLWTVPTSEAR
jgi:WD40 repeat protein